MLMKLLLSAAFGVPFGIGLYFMYRVVGIDIGLPLTIFAMCATGCLSCAFFVIYQKILDKRYAAIEAQIPFPVFYKTNGNFDLGGSVKNGNIYFCDAGIVCVSMEEKPYSMDEILPGDIRKMTLDGVHLHIDTEDGRLFKITIPDAAEVINLLQEKEWIRRRKE